MNVERLAPSEIPLNLKCPNCDRVIFGDLSRWVKAYGIVMCLKCGRQQPPDNYECPKCEKVKLRKSQWQLDWSSDPAICKICARTPQTLPETFLLPSSLDVKTREVLTRAEYKKRAREKSLPRDRICPKCGNRKFESRQWVVSLDGVMCRICWRKFCENT
jgi:transcription elongation factor Elf1